MSELEKIVLVYRKTRLEGLVERFNTKEQARFYLGQSALHQGRAASEDALRLYQREHDTYYRALAVLQNELAGLAKIHLLERSFVPNYLFAPTDLVVVTGVDGLVVNTAKYLQGQPILAVNPDPEHIDGVLLPFNLKTAFQGVTQALQGSMKKAAITMTEAVLNNGERLLAFNDLFIGAQTHVSARYRLRWNGQEEGHSSSGVIVATGAGSTGWVSSMFNMAAGLAGAFGEAAPALARPEMRWESERLIFIVREPFISKTSSAGIVCGFVDDEKPLVIESQMPAGGVIFSDGIEADYLAFNSGAIAQIGIAAQRAYLLVP